MPSHVPPHSELAYTPPAMSVRTTSARHARTIRAERPHALRVGAMGVVAGAVGLLYGMMGGLSLSAGAGVARTSVEDE